MTSCICIWWEMLILKMFQINNFVAAKQVRASNCQKTPKRKLTVC